MDEDRNLQDGLVVFSQPQQQDFSADPNVNPGVKSNFDKSVAIPYTTVLPTYNPGIQGYRVVYFDGTAYWLYIYANGGWRSQQLGITQATNKFGGDGSDGALATVSGTTTINCAGAAIVVKNYTSISITGSATLAFSNPHAGGTVIVLKSQGAVTINTSGGIDVTSMGSAGGNAGATDANGTDATAPNRVLVSNSSQGLKGASGGGVYPGNGGAGGVAGALYNNSQLFADQTYKMMWLAPGTGGAGGGGGSTANGSGGAGGAGGRGAGSLCIECAGAFNGASGTITLTGGNGSTGSNGADSGGGLGAGGAGGGGGGGGGSGGIFVALYNSLTASSLTVSKNGGTGGAGGNGGNAGNSANSGGAGGGGGSGGGSKVGAGGAGGAGVQAPIQGGSVAGGGGGNAGTTGDGGIGSNAGGGGSSGFAQRGGGGGGGGGGAGGYSTISKNSEFA